MRPLEILTSILLVMYAAWPLIGKKRSLAAHALPAVTLLIIALHTVLEGMRWQMIPLYAFSVIAFLLNIPSLLGKSPNDTTARRPLRVILNLSLLAVSTALPILLPVPYIPLPNGPYAIGTRIYELTDTSRKEIYSGKDEARRFQIQIWYPAEVKPTDERAPWMTHADVYAPAISKDLLKLPSFFLDHLALVKVPAYKEAKVATTNKGFPVILFSHGWDGFNAQNTAQALQLASHGFVVVGVQHPYGAVVTVFDDGTIAKNNPSALLKSTAPTDEYEAVAHKLVGQWAGDLSYALGFLTVQNSDINSPLYNAFDLSRVGVYGHSTGGGAAIQFCGTDTRCVALFGMDPFMRPVSYEVLESGTSQPSFFMFSQKWTDDVNSRNNELFHPFYSKAKNSLGAVYIEGTAHYDFSDLPLLSPLAPQLGLKGPINGKHVTVIVNDYLLSFFEATLNGQSTGLFTNPSPYPEIKSRQ